MEAQMAGKCGSKTRSGEPCKGIAMRNGRCRMHGGKSTGPKDQKGNKNANKHGIYAAHLTESERKDYLTLELGQVDHELRLARIRLARALAAENEWGGIPEIDEVTENEGGGVTIAIRSVKKKVRDYATLIDRLMARVESLERTRKQLDAGEGGNDEIVGFETRPYDA
jgi:hypothetical protein